MTNGNNLVLETCFAGVTLRALRRGDAEAYVRLVAGNHRHLTQFGDYHELIAATPEEIENDLAAVPEGGVRMGVWRDAVLMGRVDLNRVKPGNYVLGYWLGGQYTGNGYMTVACRAVMRYGCAELDATDFWAGVTHGNDKSVAVLVRLGFRVVERLERHTRFHRAARGFV